MQLIDEEILGHTIISSKNIQTYKSKTVFVKQWVAKITGIDPKFGFAREFIQAESDDFLEGIDIVFYYLKAGTLYQYNNLYVEKTMNASGYFAVNEAGDKILSLDKNEVRKLLGMPVKEWKEKIQKEEKKYVSDDIEF
jgi:hypothetical protein